jgi:hypothetical protein
VSYCCTNLYIKHYTSFSLISIYISIHIVSIELHTLHDAKKTLEIEKKKAADILNEIERASNVALLKKQQYVNFSDSRVGIDILLTLILDILGRDSTSSKIFISHLRSE